MANMGLNSFTISGTESDVDAFVTAAKGASEDLDFERLQPVPTHLDHLRSGSKLFNVDGQLITCAIWFCKLSNDGEVIEERPLTQEEKLAFAGLGHRAPAKWRNLNWGCQGNATEVQMHRESPEEVDYSFYTPWAPPEALVHTLRAQFPRLTISASFIEGEDLANLDDDECDFSEITYHY